MKKVFDRYCSRRSSGYDYRRDSAVKGVIKKGKKKVKDIMD